MNDSEEHLEDNADSAGDLEPTPPAPRPVDPRTVYRRSTKPRKDRIDGTEWHSTFVAAMAKSMNITVACRAAGISRSCAYQHRECYPEFAEAWDDALETAIDSLDMQAYVIAMGSKGDPEKGIEAREPSERMLMFMLSRRRRAIYGDSSRVELTGAGGGPIRHAEQEFTEADRLASIQELHARVGSQAGGTPANGETGSDRPLLAGPDALAEGDREATGSLANECTPLGPPEDDAAL